MKMFKMILASFVFMLSMSGCTDRGTFKGKIYSSYGIFDENKLKKYRCKI